LQNAIQTEPPPELAANVHRTSLAMLLRADPPWIDADVLGVGCGMPHRSDGPDITAVANMLDEMLETAALDQIILPKESLLKLTRALEPLFSGCGAQVTE
jgi:hypothetical protein